MRNFILNHASLAFWIWCVPPFLWLLSTLPAEASLEERISALLLTWTWMLLGGAAINWYSRLLLWRAVKYMDNHCDPEPLLELCSTVCRQNPSNMIFHVYQGYALSLLGRHQEAIQVLEHVAEHRKLVKNASALLIWSAALPSGDPRQEWVAEKLTALKPKMRAKQRALVDRVMNQRRSFALMPGGASTAGASAPAGSGAGGVPAGEGGSPYGTGGLLLPAGEMAAGADASGICAGQCQQAACSHPGGGTAV